MKPDRINIVRDDEEETYQVSIWFRYQHEDANPAIVKKVESVLIGGMAASLPADSAIMLERDYGDDPDVTFRSGEQGLSDETECKIDFDTGCDHPTIGIERL